MDTDVPGQVSCGECGWSSSQSGVPEGVPLPQALGRHAERDCDATARRMSSGLDG